MLERGVNLLQQEAGYENIELTPSHGQQQARTRWGTHASGKAFDQKKKPYLTEQAQEFIAQRAFCVIAGLDAKQELGGLLALEKPGFAQTPGEHTCLLRLSKHLEFSPIIQRLQRPLIASSPTHLALFFICHPTRERLCVQGMAELLFKDTLQFRHYFSPPRSIWVLLHVRQAFFHCPKYIKTRVAGLTSPGAASLQQTWQREELLSNTNRTSLTDVMRAFIAEQALCYLCTVDQKGHCAVNHRGGAPGFLVTLPPDTTSRGGTLLLPDYAGNGAFKAIGNILETGRATLIVPSFISQLALTISGSARILELVDLSEDVIRNLPGAERVVALSVQRVQIQSGNWSAFLAYEHEYAESKSKLETPQGCILTKGYHSIAMPEEASGFGAVKSRH